MVQLIIAMDKMGGIGFKNRLPWECKEELAIFLKKTMGKTLVMGSKTALAIPILKGRTIICMSRKIKGCGIQPNGFISSFDEMKSDDYIIAGGAQIYKLALETPDLVETVHLSVMKKNYCCDTRVNDRLFKDFVITKTQEYEDFTHYVMKKTDSGERQYLNLLENIMMNGKERVGRNGTTISIFKSDMMFDLRNGFPLLTTKKMFLRGILEEFLFFLRGDTNSTYLSDKKVRIWEGNTTKEFIASRGLPYAKGVLGPMYGYQWRFYNAPYQIDDNGRPISPEGGVDQLANVVNLIKTDPKSRRILLTAYNPSQAEEGVLYPCHSITVQFYVDEEYLDMFCYNRSQDAGLGIPFNISSSALLLMTVSQLTGKTSRFFHMTMGDTHIYKEHVGKLSEQWQRQPYKFPTLVMPNIKSLADINNLSVKDFKLEGYKSHPSIKMQMVA